MPTPRKQLSAADLSVLEHSFAADPASEAYRPLTEAYLAMGRFMEAMVVCKKGVKAHPDDPSARVLLDRVYADQGKDRKALEELHAIVAAYPTFAAANRLAGILHLRLGERELGEAAPRRRRGSGRPGSARGARQARRERRAAASSGRFARRAEGGLAACARRRR